jgi:hypothetical protein
MNEVAGHWCLKRWGVDGKESNCCRSFKNLVLEKRESGFHHGDWACLFRIPIKDGRKDRFPHELLLWGWRCGAIMLAVCEAVVSCTSYEKNGFRTTKWNSYRWVRKDFIEEQEAYSGKLSNPFGKENGNCRDFWSYNHMNWSKKTMDLSRKKWWSEAEVEEVFEILSHECREKNIPEKGRHEGRMHRFGF